MLFVLAFFEFLPFPVDRAHLRYLGVFGAICPPCPSSANVRNVDDDDAAKDEDDDGNDNDGVSPQDLLLREKKKCSFPVSVGRVQRTC